MLSLSAREKMWLLSLAGAGFLVYFFGDSLSMGIDAATADPADPSDPFFQYDALFQKYSAVSGVPWRWMKAICMVESALGQDPSVLAGLADPSDVDGSKSSDGLSWGLMQVTLKTARALEGIAIEAPFLNDPDNSVRLASELLKQLIGTFGTDDRESVVRAYNGGPKFGVATVPYYAKFVTNINIVITKQPGNELEI